LIFAADTILPPPPPICYFAILLFRFDYTRAPLDTPPPFRRLYFRFSTPLRHFIDAIIFFLSMLLFSSRRAIIDASAAATPCRFDATPFSAPALLPLPLFRFALSASAPFSPAYAAMPPCCFRRCRFAIFFFLSLFSAISPLKFLFA
jgi:hypothetical protein